MGILFGGTFQQRAGNWKNCLLTMRKIAHICRLFSRSQWTVTVVVHVRKSCEEIRKYVLCVSPLKIIFWVNYFTHKIFQKLLSARQLKIQNSRQNVWLTHYIRVFFISAAEIFIADFCKSDFRRFLFLSIFKQVPVPYPICKLLGHFSDMFMGNVFQIFSALV